MLKFIPGFSCWKLNNYQVLVIASCAKTHEVRVYIANESGPVHDFPDSARLPDVRRQTPCRWHALPAVMRANIRDRFHQTLTSIYGDEMLGMQHWAKAVAECD